MIPLIGERDSNPWQIPRPGGHPRPCYFSDTIGLFWVGLLKSPRANWAGLGVVDFLFSVGIYECVSVLERETQRRGKVACIPRQCVYTRARHLIALRLLQVSMEILRVSVSFVCDRWGAACFCKKRTYNFVLDYRPHLFR